MVFYSPMTLIQTGKQTQTQTNKHKSSFNNKDLHFYFIYSGYLVMAHFPPKDKFTLYMPGIE